MLCPPVLISLDSPQLAFSRSFRLRGLTQGSRPILGKDLVATFYLLEHVVLCVEEGREPVKGAHQLPTGGSTEGYQRIGVLVEARPSDRLPYVLRRNRCGP